MSLIFVVFYSADRWLQKPFFFTKGPLKVNEIWDLVSVSTTFSFLFHYARVLKSLQDCSAAEEKRERERGKNLFSKHTHVLMDTISNSSASSETLYRFKDLTRRKKNENNKQNAPTQLQDFSSFFSLMDFWCSRELFFFLFHLHFSLF